MSGPNVRASGVDYDIRKIDSYSIYDRFDFNVPLGTNGDNWDRYQVRFHGGIDLTIAAVSTVLSLAALWLAWNIYVTKRWSSDAIAKKFGVLYTLSFHKYYIDEFYALLTKYLVDGVGKILYWIDIYIVDGVVNSLAYFVGFCSRLFTKVQTGQAQQYVAVFFCGVILLVAYSLFYAHRILVLLGGAF